MKDWNWKLLRRLLWYAALIAFGMWLGHKPAKSEEGQLQFCIEKQNMLDAAKDDILWDKYFAEHKCFSLKVPYYVISTTPFDDEGETAWLGEVTFLANEQEFTVWSSFATNPLRNYGWEVRLADWNPDYAQYSDEVQKWYQAQQVTTRSRARFGCSPDPLGYCSCCNGADVVKTKFRVAEDREDAWDYWDRDSNSWLPVPDDTIHWNEPTPDGQAVIFIYPIGSKKVRCFFPPNGGAQ